LTEPEAAAQLRVCPRTLRKERQAGRLPYIKIGRVVRYDPNDLATFVEGARQCPSASEKAPRTFGTASPSPVVDFAAALEKRRSGKRRK
jgi:hypothetical protein